jgi:hypothetical protein
MWEYSNKMDLREIERVGTGWILLAQDRDKWGVRSFEHGNEISSST